MVADLAAHADRAVPGQYDTAVWQHRTRDGQAIAVEIVGGDRVLDGRDMHLVLVRDVTASRAAQAEVQTDQRRLSELTRRMLLQERQAQQRITQSLQLHLGQDLAVARLQLDAFVFASQGALPADKLATLDSVSAMLQTALGHVRKMLTDLRPPVLEDRGLLAALREEARRLQGADTLVDLLVEGDRRLARPG